LLLNLTMLGLLVVSMEISCLPIGSNVFAKIRQFHLKKLESEHLKKQNSSSGTHCGFLILRHAMLDGGFLNVEG